MLTKLIITVLFFTLNLITFSKMTEYQDFSSERSTWFFKIDKEGKNTIFSDFYPPFDPSVKVENFSPIMEYNLDSNYYFNSLTFPLFSLSSHLSFSSYQPDFYYSLFVTSKKDFFLSPRLLYLSFSLSSPLGFYFYSPEERAYILQKREHIFVISNSKG